jgi:hypothetical protein
MTSTNTATIHRFKAPPEITSSDDVIDSRDVIARIEYLEECVNDYGSGNLDLSEIEELNNLKKLADECKYAEDWQYGAALIRDSCFRDYARELVEECGYIPKDLPHWIEINWEATALNVRQDYTPVEFDGVTYWYR